MALNKKEKEKIAAHLNNTVKAEEVKPAKNVSYPDFDLNEARKGVLNQIEIEEVKAKLAALWASGLPVATTGRKPIGNTGDYTRTSFIIRKTQLYKLKALGVEMALTEKQMLEYCLEIAFKTLNK